MKLVLLVQESPLRVASRSIAGSIRGVMVVFVAFVLGLSAGAWWFFRAAKAPATVDIVQETTPELSVGSKSVIQSLNSPVAIRFYSLLDPTSVSIPMREFAARVDQLLSMYQRESNGRISVTRYNSLSDNAVSAASSDKIKPFNLEQGEPCFLGLTVICKDQKETLPFLSPEWEQALESDVARAIVRVTSTKPLPLRSADTPQTDFSAIEEVKRAIPDLANTSLEQGSQMLRLQTLAAFTAAAQEMEAQVKAAQQRVVEAKSKGSEADQQAAVKNLQQVQLAQAEKLKEVTARLQSQIKALEQMKAK